MTLEANAKSWLHRDPQGTWAAASEAGAGHAPTMVQHRVGLLARLWTFLLVIGTVLQMIGDVWEGHPERLHRATTYLFCGAAAVTAALWRICRGRARPLATVYRLEAVALLAFGSTAAWSAGGLVPDYIGGLTRGLRLEEVGRGPLGAITALALNYGALTTVFVCMLVLATHAALVPCTGAHVVRLGATLVLPLITVLVLGIGPELPIAVRWADRVQIASSTVIMSSVALTACLVINRVVHALRRQVEEARRLGQYTLEERIGSGGMGIVHRARHGMMRRPTAIKLLGGHPSDETLRRFEREVQLTACLTHPHTVTVYDYGRTPDGVFYYAMELLEGAALQEIIDVDGAQSVSRVLHVLCAVTAALVEAHELGLVHRDIKPANIILARYGGQLDFPKLVDFGLVQSLFEQEPGDRATDVQHGFNRESRPRTHEGTPLYMAPETIRNPTEVDARADLYALGAVAYAALTGTPVFRAPTIFEVLAKHAHAVPESPSERLGRPLPGDLEAVVMRCLAKSPSERPNSSRELLMSLEACGRGCTWTQREATEWWAAHEETLRARRSLRSRGSARP